MQTVLTPVSSKTDSARPEFAIRPMVDVSKHVGDAARLTMDVLGLPFDVARAQYARAVQVGLIQRSMLASRDFSRTVGALEQLTLGPWARHV